MAKPTLELMGNPPTFSEVPNARVYIHERCSQGTQISGSDFSRLCSPGTTIPTICASCKRAFPLREFRWEDTGENVADYTQRLERLLPAEYRAGRQKMNWLAGVLCLVGIPVGVLMARTAENSAISMMCGGIGAVVGWIVGFIVGGIMFVPRIEFRKYV